MTHPELCGLLKAELAHGAGLAALCEASTRRAGAAILRAAATAAGRGVRRAVELIQIAEGDCPNCGDPLELHQPDVDSPGRLLGICDSCRRWYLVLRAYPVEPDPPMPE